MKKFLKIVGLAVFAFWGTTVILIAKSQVEEYIAEHKEPEEIVETVAIVSQNSGKFIENVVLNLNNITEGVEGVTKDMKNSKDVNVIETELGSIITVNDKLEAFNEKKDYINLDALRGKVSLFNTLVEEYTTMCTENLPLGKDGNHTLIKEKEQEIIDSKIAIEELVGKIEVN